MGLFSKLFASANDKQINRLGKIADKVLALEDEFKTKSNAELRACMKDWLEYTRSYYVATSDGDKHVTELVDTYYFSGIGYDTCYTAVYKKYGDTHLCVGDEFTDQGDGTVLLYSSTAGTTDFSRIVLVPFADHYDMVQCFNEFSKESTARVLENSLNWKQKILIEWNKKIRKED